MRDRVWIVVACAAAFLAACGAPVATPTASPSVTATATATATASPSPSATPTVTPAPTPTATPSPPFSASQLIAVVKSTWKNKDPGDADCYTLSPTMSAASCQWTARLKTRVLDYYKSKAGTPSAADITCACQGGAGTPIYVAHVTATGGTVDQEYNAGTVFITYVVVDSGGTPLLDDILYEGQTGEGCCGTSVYDPNLP